MKLINDVIKAIAIMTIRGAIDKFAEFCSFSLISLSNHLKTCIQIKQLNSYFIIKNVNEYFIC